MFDTKKVAENIKKARTEQNMTQMDLADRMGVSYQAVSNWERGNSMPDISKLPELCEILEISFEELVSEKSNETRTVEKLMKNETDDVSLEDMAKVANLVRPQSFEKKIDEEIKSGKKIPYSALMSLAPFLSRGLLDKIVLETEDFDPGKLVGLAPFLSRDALDGIVTKSLKKGDYKNGRLVGLAPFLGKDTLKKIADHLGGKGEFEMLAAFAPFMGVNVMTEMFGGDDPDDSDDSDEETVELAIKALEEGRDISSFLEYMDEEDVAQLAMAAMDKGLNVLMFLEYMDEEDVADLATKALESDKDVLMFLEYMDEVDVGVLANKALEKGMDISAFLEYMDEDDVKALFRKSLKK